MKVLRFAMYNIDCMNFRHLLDKPKISYKCKFDCLDAICHICGTVFEV